jgi:hypothetical protein
MKGLSIKSINYSIQFVKLQYGRLVSGIVWKLRFSGLLVPNTFYSIWIPYINLKFDLRDFDSFAFHYV